MPDAISNKIVLPSILGMIQVSLPFFLESQKDEMSGISAPHAGFGHVTVLAHIQAITVASPPPCSFGNVTFG